MNSKQADYCLLEVSYAMKNSTHSRELSFWAWVKKIPMPYALCKGATIPLQTPGDGVSRRFQ
ncbi:MAG: hypothetical protein ICV54_27695 [Nostoc sp. C3-bin3]|nr:hypothetical protein [Nostoc sp. C3-bin3]